MEFLDRIQTADQLTESLTDIAKTRSIRVVTWFIGNKKLDRKWLTLLCDDLVSPIRELFNSRKFFLYSLYNWNGLSNRSVDSTSANPETNSYKTLQNIESLGCSDLSCLDSSRYFSFLKTCECAETVRYVAEQVWSRDFIWSISERLTQKQIVIRLFRISRVLGARISHASTPLGISLF